MPRVNVTGIGKINFPDNMTPSQIADVIETQIIPQHQEHLAKTGFIPALKSYIGQLGEQIVFEPNTQVTRNKFLSQVNPYLESVQQRSGLYAFQVVMDDTNNTPDLVDRNILYGQIYLQPTKTAEFIVLDFNILPTGATFPGA